MHGSKERRKGDGKEVKEKVLPYSRMPIKKD
jgi:hypothetical protein